jgi:hypothetical protein
LIPKHGDRDDEEEQEGDSFEFNVYRQVAKRSVVPNQVLMNLQVTVRDPVTQNLGLVLPDQGFFIKASDEEDKSEEPLQMTEEVISTTFPPFFPSLESSSSTPVSRDIVEKLMKDQSSDEVDLTTVSTDAASTPPETTTNIMSNKLPEQTEAPQYLSPLSSSSSDKISSYGPDDYPLTTRIVPSSSSSLNYSTVEETTVPSFPSTSSGSSYTPFPSKKDEVDVTTTESFLEANKQQTVMTTTESSALTNTDVPSMSMSEDTPLSYAWIFPTPKSTQVSNLPKWTDSSRGETVAASDHHVKRKAPTTTIAPVQSTKEIKKMENETQTVSQTSEVKDSPPATTTLGTTSTTAAPSSTTNNSFKMEPIPSSTTTTTTTETIISKNETQATLEMVQKDVAQETPGTTKAQPSFDFLKSHTTPHVTVATESPPRTDDHWSLWESMLVCRNIKSPRVLAESLRNMRGYHFNFIVFDSVKLPQPFPFSLFDKFSFDFFEMLNISSLQFSNNFSDKGRDYDYGRSYARNAGGNTRFTRRTTPAD